jgi:hypothetical protein
VQKLKTVLLYRLDPDDMKTEALHQVASILDEAAQKIERL